MQRLSFIFATATMIIAACNGLPSGSDIPGTEHPSVEQTAAKTTEAASIISDPDIWRPALRTSWQWQLSDLPVDLSIDVDMYDIDLFENDAEVVAALHASARRVICYINAGGWEEWRPDAGQFPDVVIGKNLNGWPGERWLDIRQIDQLAPIIEARLDMCKDRGFDGVEPDNVDGYLNDTGFPLSYADQLRFNLWLSTEAHERGLSIGLKNDLEQVPDLVEHFDWALNEECFAYDECETLLPFIAAGKAVFHVEYEFDPREFCDQVNALNFNSMRKDWDLGARQAPCW